MMHSHVVSSHGWWTTAEWTDEVEVVNGCPACGCEQRRFLYGSLRDVLFGAPGSWSYWRCLSCRSAFVDPRPTRRSIALAYRTYYTHKSAANRRRRGVRALKQRISDTLVQRNLGYDVGPTLGSAAPAAALIPFAWRHAGRKLRHLPAKEGARLLDVGCGDGAYLLAMSRLGWDALGVEFDERAARTARASGANVTVCSAERLSEVAAPQSVDAVTLAHVLEHLHDPFASLRAIHQVLRPSGLIWIATPNLASIGHRVFGRDWRGLEPPRHTVVFSPDALEALLIRAGFCEITQVPTQPLGRRMFRESIEIGDRSGVQRGHVSRALSRALAPIADSVSGVIPRLGEELVYVARRR